MLLAIINYLLMQLALKRKVENYCQVLAWQNRSIYLKGTGLEKENFKE